MSDRPTRSQLMASVAAIAPHLDPESTAFRTALVYLARTVTPSIDLIASRTGCAREFVALRARRWADRGRWDVSRGATREITADELALAVEIGEGTFREEPAPRGELGWLADGRAATPWLGTPIGDDPLDTVWVGLAAGESLPWNDGECWIG